MALHRHLSNGQGFLYRPLLRGLLLSLVLHGLVLVPAAVLMTPSTGERPLAATLGRPAVEVAPSAASRPEIVQRQAPAFRPLPLPAVAKPADGPAGVNAVARAQAPFQADEGLDPDALRAYRLAIARQSRILRGSTMAADWGRYQGRVEVRLRFGDGPSLVSLERSSGQPETDGAALRLVGEAMAAAIPPESLRNKRFELLLPVIFGD